jgi:hypothetical protein
MAVTAPKAAGPFRLLIKDSDQVALVPERIATLYAMEQRISRRQEDLEPVYPIE